MPKSNVEYWQKKLRNNVSRFSSQKKELIRLNYKVLVIWECETKEEETLTLKLKNYFAQLD